MLLVDGSTPLTRKAFKGWSIEVVKLLTVRVHSGLAKGDLETPRLLAALAHDDTIIFLSPNWLDFHHIYIRGIMNPKCFDRNGRDHDLSRDPVH